MKYAIGKTVASVETEVVTTTTSGNTTTAILAIIFTDGSRITFGACEVEYGDPVPRATYHGKVRKR